MSSTMGTAFGKLPRRCLVAISHADAALMRMSFVPSVIIRRAASDNRALPPSHQMNALVSGNTPTANRPLAGVGRKEVVGNIQFVFHCPELSFARRLAEDESRDRLAAVGNNHIFACLDPSQQFGQLDLGLMDIDDGHGFQIP